jgi:hypothetical protein
MGARPTKMRRFLVVSAKNHPRKFSQELSSVLLQTKMVSDGGVPFWLTRFNGANELAAGSYPCAQVARTWQLSRLSYQLSAISYQLSAVSDRLTAHQRNGNFGDQRQAP